MHVLAGVCCKNKSLYVAPAKLLLLVVLLLLLLTTTTTDTTTTTTSIGTTTTTTTTFNDNSRFAESTEEIYITFFPTVHWTSICNLTLAS